MMIRTDSLHSMLDPRTQTEQDMKFYSEVGKYFESSVGDTLDKLKNFSKYVPRQNMALFLAKNEIFKQIVDVHGHIIECGVFVGGGLMSWAQLSAIYEPYNHVRRVIGFDSFEGFPSLSERDVPPSGGMLHHAVVGGLAVNAAEEDVRRAVDLYDLNRPIGHIPRVELAKGDAVESIPKFISENEHTVVALLYLDFDLYEPTKVAIEAFLPRMPKGAVIAFDELNQKHWPGETRAVLDAIGIRNLRVKRFPFNPQISYAMLD
jgi:Macrocin-O-methyltransferase (TylF)